MIPKIIHQTWRDHDIPGPKEWPESWKNKNKDWEYRFWTDADLLALVQTHYPELEELYQSYPNPVQRADLGRYLILHHCGGVYADLDTECLTSLDEIADETRIIFAEEPREHRFHTDPLGMPFILFNGVMASPKGHRFWPHLIKVLIQCKTASDRVLESTGPLMMTGAYSTFSAPDTIAIHSCHLFNPLTETGRESTAPLYGPYAHLRICNHYWQGSWFNYNPVKRRKKYWNSLKKAYRKTRYNWTRGKHLTSSEVEASLDKSLLYSPVKNYGAKVAIFVPVRDAEDFLDRCFELIAGLDFPKKQIRLVFCEGDSTDNTREKLSTLSEQYREIFEDIEILTCETGSKLKRENRWSNRIQYVRRSNLAKVRNHLIKKGLKDEDWVLWIDVDVCDYDPGILKRLMSEEAKVVTPDCVLEYGERSYDMNAFNDDGQTRDHKYYKYVKGGLFMPPATHFFRRHLHVFRFLDRVPLSSVGGTMLLVHANVHRAGVVFPEIPYDDLLETEGFGRICYDMGAQPIGLPNVQIKHVSS